MIDLRKYPRSKDQKNTVALRSPNRNRKITKRQVLAFIRYHYPKSNVLRIRIARNYKKGSIALITCSEQLWT